MLKNGKKVLVFGSGKSGIGAVMLLEHEGVDTILYDGNEKLDPEEIRRRLPKDSKAEIIFGPFPEDQMEKIGLAVLSPGVPVDLPVVEKMKADGSRSGEKLSLHITMAGEMYWLLRGRMERRPPRHFLVRL